MDRLLYILTRSVHLFITAMMFFLLARVLLSFFFDEESPLNIFCCVVTEPVVYPVRVLLSRIPALEDFPIDVSFMATSLILMLVQAALPLS